MSASTHDRLRAAARGEGLDTAHERAQVLDLAAAELGFDDLPPEARAAMAVYVASRAHTRPVESASDARLVLAECAVAAALDAVAGLPMSPWLPEVVARCERALGDAELPS